MTSDRAVLDRARDIIGIEPTTARFIAAGFRSPQRHSALWRCRDHDRADPQFASKRRGKCPQSVRTSTPDRLPHPAPHRLLPHAGCANGRLCRKAEPLLYPDNASHHTERSHRRPLGPCNGCVTRGATLCRCRFRTSRFEPRPDGHIADARIVATKNHSVSNADATATIRCNCSRDGRVADRRRARSGNRHLLGDRRRMDDTAVGGRRTLPVE